MKRGFELPSLQDGPILLGEGGRVFACTHGPRAASLLAWPVFTEPNVAAGRGLSDVVTARTLKAAPETSEDSMLGRLAAVF